MQLVEQMDFLFVADDAFSIDGSSWVKLASTERVREVLDAVIEHVETCEWTIEALDLRALIDGLGLKARKAMPALYAAIEGRAAGAAAVRLHLAARPRARAGAAAERARTPRLKLASERKSRVSYHERRPSGVV